MKTVKSYLKKCLEIAYTDRDELKGFEKLSGEDYSVLGDIRAAVQNELVNSPELLEKFGLKYKSSGSKNK